jgi:DNA-binding transcriptional MerR regulator
MIKLFKRKSFDEKWSEVVSKLKEHGVNIDDIINYLASRGYDKVEILIFLEDELKRVKEMDKLYQSPYFLYIQMMNESRWRCNGENLHSKG